MQHIHGRQRHLLYTYMCTGRKEAASEYGTRNLAIMSPMRYSYTIYYYYFFIFFKTNYEYKVEHKTIF